MRSRLSSPIAATCSSQRMSSRSTLAKKDADRAQKAFDAAEAAEQEERAYRDMVRDEENLVGYDALHADYQFRAKDALKEQKQDWKDIRPVISTIASDITQMLVRREEPRRRAEGHRPPGGADGDPARAERRS
jgi:hypothetical protein